MRRSISVSPSARSRSSSTDLTSDPSCSRWPRCWRLLVGVELALDPVDRAVKDVGDPPEHVLEVGLEAGVRHGGGEPFERVGNGGSDELIFGERPWVWFALEGAMSEQLEFVEKVSGRALGVVGFVVVGSGMIGHGVSPSGRSAAPFAASWATTERGQPGPAPRGRLDPRPEAQRRTAKRGFLASRGMGASGVPARLAAWGGRPGEES